MTEARANELIAYAKEKLWKELCLHGWNIHIACGGDPNDGSAADMRCDDIDPYRKVARITVFERRIDSDAEFCRAIVHEFLHVVTSATVEFRDLINDLVPNYEQLVGNAEVNCSEKIVGDLMFIIRYGLGDEMRQWFRDDKLTLEDMES